MKSKQNTELRPGREVGGYRLDRMLGEGGFGGVYLAWQKDRPSALKFLHLDSVGPWGWRELFVLLPRQLPHVVRLHGHFKWPEDSPEYLVLVMEYIPGVTLYTWAREHNPSALEVVEKLLPLGRALKTLHARGVFHRDLKGDNVLVRESDGAPVLVDFGAGISPHAPRATWGALPPASLRYRSPESLAFIQGHQYVSKSRYQYAMTDELYALGVMLYVLLTDEYPFDGEEQEEVIQAILVGHHLPPHVRNPRVPESLSRLCMDLLALNPQERVPNAKVLCERLEALLLENRGEKRWELPLCYGWGDNEHTTEKDLPGGGAPPPGPVTPTGSTWMSRALPILLVLGLGAVLGVRLKERGEDLEEAPTPETVWTDQDIEPVMGATAPPPLTPNQKRAPCTAGLEREVNGGCWLPIERKSPKCPPQTLSYEGSCLLRVAKPQPVPVSLDAGGPAPTFEPPP
ncbi:serine/threonine protein kinase [Cystobacter fuscus]|uniref:serine/threonine protein kinase n=1 Tax=Cystobacter fuscus TaxID=43 RepID=UPI002B289159|nr:serine/threonine protein kinase [Cystobacter fuscus]